MSGKDAIATKEIQDVLGTLVAHAEMFYCPNASNFCCHQNRDGPTTIRTALPVLPSPYVASLSTASTPSRPTISTVKYWSDFSRLCYHPRSIVQLNDYTLGSSLQPFDNYTSGDELFDSLDKEHDLLDRDLRLWVEECDQMQGVQLFTGADDAWGGFAGKYMERLRDEYGKVGIWVWGIEDGDEEGRKVCRRCCRMAQSKETWLMH